MRLYIDGEICIGCGDCIYTCPEVFHWNEDGTMALAIDTDIPAEFEDLANQAMFNCPVEAIKDVGTARE
ncbi:MAG: ferredoxin [Thermoanaerobacteraceae bacterium]|nr:ferredoxin [Thermoanaerobacteraceae bacterium]